MKIAVLLECNIFEISSASANRWRTMIEGLARQDVEVHLIVSQGYQSLAEYRKYGKLGKFGKIVCHYTVFMLQSSLWWRRINKYFLSSLTRKINSLKVSKLLRRLNPDIVILHPSLESLDLYSRISSGEKQQHKLMIELNEFNNIGAVHATNKLQKLHAVKYNKLLINKILPQVDLFVIMTKRLIQHYRELSGNTHAKYLHLPMTVDLSRFDISADIDLKKPYIAFVGSLNNKKDGIDILIKAFAEIVQIHGDFTLYLVGNYQHDVDTQKTLIRELSLEKKVIYLGEKKRDEIPPIIMNATLLVLPRPDSRQAQGGFPTKLGEYLATSNPACATRVGELPDYLEDNKNVFFADPGDVTSFADAMQRALSNKNFACQVGRNGRKVAEKHFNMDVQALQLFEFLKTNLGDK